MRNQEKEGGCKSTCDSRMDCKRASSLRRKKLRAPSAALLLYFKVAFIAASVLPPCCILIGLWGWAARGEVSLGVAFLFQNEHHPLLLLYTPNAGCYGGQKLSARCLKATDGQLRSNFKRVEAHQSQGSLNSSRLALESVASIQFVKVASVGGGGSPTIFVIGQFLHS